MSASLSPVRGRVAEVAPAVDHLLRRAAADPELQPAAGDEVRRARVLGHVQRVLVAHVDHGGADLDRARPRADGRKQRERRAELAREMVHAEVRAVGAQLLGGDGELDRLQQRVGRGAHLRAVTSPSSARTTGTRSSSTPVSVRNGASLGSRHAIARVVCRLRAWGVCHAARGMATSSRQAAGRPCENTDPRRAPLVCRSR